MESFSIATRSRTDLVDVTERVAEVLRRAGGRTGAVLVYIPHTTAGVTINENADPSVRADILLALKKMVPDSLPYEHSEGNSPAHIKAGLVGSSVMVMVEHGRLNLGTWQGIYFCEFDGPRRRKVWVRLLPS